MNTYSPTFNTFAARKFIKNIISRELPITFYQHVKTCYFTIGIDDNILIDIYYHNGRPEMIVLNNKPYYIRLMADKNSIVNDLTKAAYDFIIKRGRGGYVEDQFVEYFSEWAKN